MDYNAEMQKLIKQEELLTFDYFDSDTALHLGMAIIQAAKDMRAERICVDICAYGQRMFHFCNSGCSPSNDIWADRKHNTVLFSGHSTLHTHYFLASLNESIQEKWKLDPAQYAQIGGGFPIRLKGNNGVIGTVVYSGFTHQEDHQILVDTLSKFLNVAIP